MKQLFRAVVLLLLVGGWGLSAAALHVIRTDGNFVIVPKDRLAVHDTWVDTRKWTVSDDRAHAEVVARLVHLNRSDLLRHTLPAGTPAEAADVALAAIAANQPVPGVATSAAAAGAVDKFEGEAKTIVTAVKGSKM